VAAETKQAAAETKPVAAKQAAAETKPVAAKQAAAKTKPVAAETKQAATETKPVAAEPASAGAEPASSAAEPKMTFLILYRPGPAWVPGKHITEQSPKGHGTYLLDLFAKGTMKLAGPLMDDAGGAVVIEVAGEAEATAIARGDPAVQKGVFVFELHPWKLVPWEKYLKKPPGSPPGRDAR
jgi:uncharacterized protein YciI